MVTFKSKKREIADLQRLLLSVGLLDASDKSTDGVWGDATQGAVVRLYADLGWSHPTYGRWVTTPALAAISVVLRSEFESGTGGGGSHTGGGGSHTGGGGSHTGGGGSHTGGGSSPE